MTFSRVDFGAIKDGGDDVTAALRKLDLNMSVMDGVVADQDKIVGRLQAVESVAASLGQAATRDVGVQAGTVAAGNDGRFNMGAWRNKIINGNLDFWQGGLTTTASGGINPITWGPDRFLGQAFTGSNGSGDSSVSLSAQAFDAGQNVVPNYPSFYARLQPMSLATLGSTGGMIRIGHYIENVTTLSGGYAAVSFWAKSNASRTIAVSAQQNFGTNGSPSVVKSTTLSIGTSWSRYTAYIKLDSMAGKAVGANSNLFIGIYLFSQDSNYGVVPVGSWSTGQYLDVAQVQVESVAGPETAASPFEMRPLFIEEALVRRYTTVSKPFIIGRWASPSSVRFYNDYEVPMRRIPDCVLLNSSLNCEMAQVAGYTMSNASVGAFASDNRRCFIDFNGSVNGTPSGGAMAQMNSSAVVLFRAEF